jgi:hypothetical protein
MSKFKTKIRKEINKDLKLISTSPYRIYDHITGNRFSHRHKMITGGFLALLGVFIAKYLHTFGGVVGFAGDWVGYALHGGGFIPVFEYLGHRVKTEIEVETE